MSRRLILHPALVHHESTAVEPSLHRCAGIFQSRLALVPLLGLAPPPWHIPVPERNSVTMRDTREHALLHWSCPVRGPAVTGRTVRRPLPPGPASVPDTPSDRALRPRPSRPLQFGRCAVFKFSPGSRPGRDRSDRPDLLFLTVPSDPATGPRSREARGLFIVFAVAGSEARSVGDRARTSALVRLRHWQRKMPPSHPLLPLRPPSRRATGPQCRPPDAALLGPTRSHLLGQ
jgi:hypothetical protein